MVRIRLNRRHSRFICLYGAGSGVSEGLWVRLPGASLLTIRFRLTLLTSRRRCRRRICQQPVRPPLTPDHDPDPGVTQRVRGRTPCLAFRKRMSQKTILYMTWRRLSAGKRGGGAARGNTPHWRVILGGVSAVVIVWPRWRGKARRCPATPEDEEAVYGSSLRVNEVLFFTDPPPPLYSRGCLLGRAGAGGWERGRGLALGWRPGKARSQREGGNWLSGMRNA